MIASGKGEDVGLSQALDETLHAARALPATGWRNRIKDGQPNGPTEDFLALALPFNVDGKFTPQLPAIGLSTCAGPIPATISTPAPTPAAVPADAVTATPYYTG